MLKFSTFACYHLDPDMTNIFRDRPSDMTNMSEHVCKRWTWDPYYPPSLSMHVSTMLHVRGFIIGHKQTKKGLSLLHCTQRVRLCIGPLFCTKRAPIQIGFPINKIKVHHIRDTSVFETKPCRKLKAKQSL